VISVGLPDHGSRLMQGFVASQARRLELEWLPSYVSELNRAQYLCGHLKYHELRIVCPKNLSEPRPSCDPKACVGGGADRGVGHGA
jgi:transposase